MLACLEKGLASQKRRRSDAPVVALRKDGVVATGGEDVRVVQYQTGRVLAWGGTAEGEAVHSVRVRPGAIATDEIFVCTAREAYTAPVGGVVAAKPPAVEAVVEEGARSPALSCTPTPLTPEQRCRSLNEEGPRTPESARRAVTYETVTTSSAASSSASSLHLAFEPAGGQAGGFGKCKLRNAAPVSSHRPVPYKRRDLRRPFQPAIQP